MVHCKQIKPFKKSNYQNNFIAQNFKVVLEKWDFNFIKTKLLFTHLFATLANSEDAGENPQKAEFHQGFHCLLSIKTIFIFISYLGT